MTVIQDGGSAYPVIYAENEYVDEYGMSLRDWFAGQALASMAATTTPMSAARQAYDYADAMLAIRKEAP